jgi:hypothetical protein
MTSTNEVTGMGHLYRNSDCRLACETCNSADGIPQHEARRKGFWGKSERL